MIAGNKNGGDRVVINGQYDIRPQIEQLDGGVTSLTFGMRNLWQGSTITVRLESRTGTKKRYWYAYKKVNGKTRKMYIGKELTAQKLTAAWAKLSGLNGVIK